MNIVSIGTDRKLFEHESAVRARTLEYAAMATEFHIIVFTKKSMAYEPEQIASNAWLYPTQSLTKFGYITDAYRIAKKIISEKKLKSKTIITTQDPFETGRVGLMIKMWANKGRIYADEIKLHVQIHTDFLSPYFSQESFLNKMRVYISRRVLKNADSIRVVSERIKKSLDTIQPGLSVRASVLPIYVSVEKFKQISGMLLHERYPQFTSFILIASRLTKEKNIFLALDIFKRSQASSIGAALVIIGEGPLKESLKEKTRQLGIQDNVIFEPWKQDLHPYYFSTDVFLLTSLYEGYGLTLMEAYISGCPIISTNVGIVAEIIKPGENGFIISQNDTIGGALALTQILEEKQLFKAKARTLADRTIFMSKDEYLKLYKQSWDHCYNNVL